MRLPWRPVGLKANWIKTHLTCAYFADFLANRTIIDLKKDKIRSRKPNFGFDSSNPYRLLG